MRKIIQLFWSEYNSLYKEGYRADGSMKSDDARIYGWLDLIHNTSRRHLILEVSLVDDILNIRSDGRILKTIKL